MKRSRLIATAAVAVTAIACAVAWEPIRRAFPVKPEAFWAQFTHVYVTREGMEHIVPLATARKDAGPITDLDGDVIDPAATAPAEVDGVQCVITSLNSDESGYRWNRPGTAYPVTAYAPILLLACRQAVARLEQQLMPTGSTE